MTTVLYTLHIVPERSGQLPVATSQKHPQFQDLKVKVKGVQVHFFFESLFTRSISALKASW